MSYASKFYDPVKAHEYYEKNKQLKGRRPSTKGMTASQKEMAAYVKDNLNTEKKEKIKEATTQSNSSRDSEKSRITSTAQAQRTRFTKICSSRIATLRSKLKGMNKMEKAKAKRRIQREIDSIKKEFSKRRLGVTAIATDNKKKVSSKYSESLTKTKQNIRSDYDNKYDSALQDIRTKI